MALSQIGDHSFDHLSSIAVGASPQQGISLAAGEFYNNIVDVPSRQQPSLDRVEPGQPEQSYLYLKITGDASITGAHMPFGQQPLDSPQIVTIE